MLDGEAVRRSTAPGRVLPTCRTVGGLRSAVHLGSDCAARGVSSAIQKEDPGPSRRCRFPPRSLVFLPLLILSVTACEESAPSNLVNEPFVVSDSLGVTLADNFVQEWELDDELRLGAIPKMRIGAEGSGLELWGVQDVVGTEEGGFLIGMSAGQEILLLDTVGEEVGRVEATGEGPGEFLRLRDLVVRPRGGFAGYDPQLQRVVIFDDDGQVDRSVTIHAGGGAAQRSLLGFLEGEPMLFGEERAPEPDREAGPVVVKGDLVVYSPDGHPGDTLMTLPFQEYHRFNGQEATSGTLPAEMRLPLASRAFVRVHDEKVYVAHGDAYEVQVMDASGSMETLIRYRGARRSFDSAHRESIIHRMG